MDKISVVLDNYNYGDFIGEALQSVLEQTILPYEVIVVDDGSTDNSRDIIDDFVARNKFIRAIYQTNGGQTKAFNTGVKHAIGDIVCFLDSDDKWYPAKLEKVLEKHSKYDIVQHYLRINGNEIYRPIDCSVDWKKALVKYGYLFAHSPTSGLSFSTRLLKRFMPFENPELLRYCTDGAILMLAMYFSETGIGFIEEALGYYRVHERNMFINNTDSLSRGRGILKDREIFINDFLVKNNYKSIPFSETDYYYICINEKLKRGELSSEKDVYIWGTEFSGERVTNVLNDKHINIIGYIDSNPQKLGCKFMNKYIYSPESILKQKPDENVVIIIANSSHVVLSDMLKGTEWKNNYLDLPI